MPQHTPTARATTGDTGVAESAAVLRDAIGHLDTLTRAASEGPWSMEGMGESGWAVALGSGAVFEMDDTDQGRADALYTAAMNPLVATALVKLLSAHLAIATLAPAVFGGVPDQAAVRLARALLNGRR
ncbi:hypothetical protein [Streptomyces sp. NPDC059071]|uniref:hypothetical protein n=1 Tax=unclassified Streptomyces TaxID=2593676 RepID=UPI00365874A1